MVKLLDWLLDTASTIMLTCKRAGLKFIHTVSQEGYLITLIGGTTIATEYGCKAKWDKLFWIYLILDGSPLNILSFGILANQMKNKGDH